VRSGDWQPSSAEDEEDSDLTADEHLQVPNQVNWHTQHRNVGDPDEGGGGDVEVVDVETASRICGVPDLASWWAEEDWDGEEDDVEDGVGDDEGLGELPPEISLNRQEDSKHQQQDGYFIRAEGDAVDHVDVVCELWMG